MVAEPSSSDRSGLNDPPDLGLLLDSIFQQMKYGIAVYSLSSDGVPTLVEANPFLFSMMGMPGEASNQAIHDALTCGGVNEIIPSIRTVASNSFRAFRAKARKKDGAIMFMDVNVNRIAHEGKDYFIVIAADVTSKQLEESANREQEARFRVIFEEAPVGIMLQDKDRHLVECNKALSEMTGLDKDDLLQRRPEELVHQEDVEKDARLYDLLMAGRIDHYNVEKRFVTHDGRVIYGNLHVSSIKDEEGKPSFALNMLSDITQRKRMEVEVLRTRDYYQSMLDNMPTLMWRSNDQLMREFFNKAWLGFTGRTFNEEYGHGWMRGVHPDDIDRLMEAQERSFLTQENFEIEYRLLAFDNQYHWMIDMARPFYDSHGDFKGYVGSVNDNTRYRKMQERDRQHQTAKQ
ncbi:MAG: putative diguanylate cyclase [Methanomassiliicoccales archaeon PtaU1.Bin124]|nr:MAG: putative diguanylate cyclase [Methanomassiliicoccales archaeon PtaU1.Bin124]